MAKAKGGDSKQGLIITLVIFVLLSIGLGVSTYLGFDGQQQLEAKAKEAEKKEASMTKNRDFEKLKALMLKQYIGIGQPADVDDIQRLSKESDGERKAEIKKLTTDLAELGWDDEKAKPTTTYRKVVDNLKAELKNAQTELETTKKTNEDLVANKDAAIKTLQQEKAKANELVQEVQAKAKQDLEEFAKKMLNGRDQRFEAVMKEKDEAKKKDAEEIQKLVKAMGDRDKEMKEVKVKLRHYEEGKKAPDLLAYESPRGAIKSLERHGDFAYIDLGSSARVQPQLRFSIFDHHAGAKPTGEPKGSLEIVQVMGPRLSKARITSVRDPNRAPVEVGDYIFNPSWRPDEVQHIAIAGLIDLTGDGTDSSREVMRDLRRQNIVVDEYLDLKTLKFYGQMSVNTMYLVLGEAPTSDVLGLVGGDEATSRLKDIRDKLGEAQKEAEKYGVTVVPARKFLIMSGYPLPRQTAPADYRLHGGVKVGPEPDEGKEPADAGKEKPPAPEKPAKPPAKDKKPPKGEDKADNGKDMGDDKMDEKPKAPAPKGQPK